MSCDPSLLELFHAEAETHMGVLTAGILELERDPRQATRYEELMRAAHSIKGAARIVGIDRAVALAHVIEDCFVAARQGQIALSSETVDVLLPAVDLLQAVTQAHVGTPQPSDAQIEQVVQLVRSAMTGTPVNRPEPVITPTNPPAPQRPASVQPATTQPIAVQPTNVRPPRNFAAPETLDFAWVKAQRAALSACFAEHISEIRLDLSHTTSVAPSGAALLALLARAASQPSAVTRLTLVNTSPTIASLLTALRLTPPHPAVGEGG